MAKKNKIGIFSGTFDPIHSGHIKFALESAEAAGLDKVYFLPEALPRRKTGMTHYAHRVAMLRLALKPYRNLEVLEVPDKQFSTNRTLPKLTKHFSDSELYLLIGTDMLALLVSAEAGQQWPDAEKFVRQVRLVVGVRTGTKESQAQEYLDLLGCDAVIVNTSSPHVSSRDIRSSLTRGNDHDELLESLKSYVKQNWLYASVAVNNS